MNVAQTSTKLFSRSAVRSSARTYSNGGFVRRSKAISLDSFYGKNDKLAAQTLAALQVQVFTDLATEIRRMMRPFIRMNRAVYSTFRSSIVSSKESLRAIRPD